MPQNSPIPHDSWAEAYDIAYEQSFGRFYESLTTAPLELVLGTILPPARIVDFGAGTGRLSIPLAGHGFQVDAVDPSTGMLDQLRAKDPKGTVAVHRMRMQDFRAENAFDMALCVFTVLLYLLDEEALEQSLEAAFRSLRSGGTLLIDIPSKALFRSSRSEKHGIDRYVTVEHVNDAVFTYREQLTIRDEDGERNFTDEFQIRHWSFEKVVETLMKVGFQLEKNFSRELAGSGSQYLLMKKRQGGR